MRCGTVGRFCCGHGSEPRKGFDCGSLQRDAGDLRGSSLWSYALANCCRRRECSGLDVAHRIAVARCSPPAPSRSGLLGRRNDGDVVGIEQFDDVDLRTSDIVQKPLQVRTID
jgi:hypothetical protein